jgi:hypothetical protein
MSISISQYQVLPTLAGLLGAVPILIGVRGLLWPQDILASVGFPAPTKPEAQKLANALTCLISARNIVIGLTSLAIWHRGDRELQGSAMIIFSIFPLVDGLVSRQLVEGHLLSHFPIVPIAAGLGAGLLGVFG